MRVFDLELKPEHLEAMAAHAERDYPREACGLGFADGEGRLQQLVPIANLQDKYHAKDPEQFPRDAKSAFRLDELARLRALEVAEAKGQRERLIYHSHPDAGAYFSAEDRAMAVMEGQELVPGAVHIVVSVRDGKRADAAAFRYQAETEAFLEARLPLVAVASSPLPDLELRSMEGGEAIRPIAPVGGRLTPRVVTAEERLRLEALELRRLTVSDEVQHQLALFGAGLLSPLGGFLRKAERESVEARGRLLSGTAWRWPLVLHALSAESGAEPELERASLVELVSRDGRGLGVLAIEELEKSGSELELAGPVYVYETELPKAVDARAWLLRAGARRVLAIPHGTLAPGSGVLLGFDAIIAPAALELPLSMPRWPAPPGLVASWLGAVLAQNLGATDLHTDDTSLARTLRDTLAIRPFPGETPRS